MNAIRNRSTILRAFLGTKVPSLVLATAGLIFGTSTALTANDYGIYRGGSCYNGSYGGGYGYSYQGYRDYSHRDYSRRDYGSSCNRDYGQCQEYGNRFPVLPVDTSCWTYSCSLGDYGCNGYYHPEYKCWYYYYPQQQVFIPTQYITAYPPAPQQNFNDNDNFNDNRNDNLNDNLNDNFNQNRNENDSTNVTNINIGTGIVPIQGQPQLNQPTPHVDSPPQPVLPSLPNNATQPTIQPLQLDDSSVGQPIPLPPRASSSPLSVAKRN